MPIKDKQGKGFERKEQAKGKQPQFAPNSAADNAFEMVQQGTQALDALNGLLLNNGAALVEEAERRVDENETMIAQRLAAAYHPDLSASRILVKTANFLSDYGRNPVDRTSLGQSWALQAVPQLQLASLSGMYEPRQNQQQDQAQLQPSKPQSQPQASSTSEK